MRHNVIEGIKASVLTAFYTPKFLVDAVVPLEASTYCTPTSIGGFPQVSGIEFTVDTTKAYDQGEQYPGSTYYGPNNVAGHRVHCRQLYGRG